MVRRWLNSWPGLNIHSTTVVCLEVCLVRIIWYLMIIPFRAAGGLHVMVALVRDVTVTARSLTGLGTGEREILSLIQWLMDITSTNLILRLWYSSPLTVVPLQQWCWLIPWYPPSGEASAPPAGTERSQHQPASCDEFHCCSWCRWSSGWWYHWVPLESATGPAQSRSWLSPPSHWLEDQLELKSII